METQSAYVFLWKNLKIDFQQELLPHASMFER